MIDTCTKCGSSCTYIEDTLETPQMIYVKVKCASCEYSMWYETEDEEYEDDDT